MEDFIGVFDSGHGGLTVLKDLKKTLPDENFYYFGDSLRAPYGTKTKEEITQFSHRIAEDMIKKGAKAIVVACNTATSAAIESLRSTYSIPIIGMEPALRTAMEDVETGKILVIATSYTIHNEKYRKLEESLGQYGEVEAVPTPKLVDFVEEGLFREEEIFEYFKELGLKRDDYKAVVLGCTHFLFIKKEIGDYFHSATLYDGNIGTALHLKNILEKRNLLQQKSSPWMIIDNSKDSERQRAQWLYKKLD